MVGKQFTTGKAEEGLPQRKTKEEVRRALIRRLRRWTQIFRDHSEDSDSEHSGDSDSEQEEE
jgi:hypothetical protein